MTDSIGFGKFMTNVLYQANKTSFDKRGESLSDIYHIPSTIIKMIGAITNTGWDSFKVLYEVLSKTSYMMFISSLPSFLLSPAGAVVSRTLVFWNGIESIKLLYDNKKIIKDIKDLGDIYEQKFRMCSSMESQDLLENEAIISFLNMK